MNGYSLLATAAAVLYAVAAVYAARVQRRALTNRVFAFCCLLFAVWALAFALLCGATSGDQAWVWHRLSAPGWTVTPAVLLHFLLLMTEHDGWLRRMWVRALLYAPGLILLVRALTGTVTVTALSPVSWGWAQIVSWNPWSIAYTVYYAAYIGTGLVLTHRWGRRGDVPARARQARIVLATGIAAIGLALVTNRVLPGLGVRSVPNLAPVLVGIWVAGIWYAMNRHSLMMLTPGTAAEAILATMSDPVLLTGPDNRIIRVNPAATRAFGMDEKALLGANIKDVLPFEDVTTSQVMARVRTTEGSIRHEGWVQGTGGRRAPVDIASATVKDRNGQTLGVVTILRDMSERRKTEDELKHLANHDTLTNLPNRLLLHDRLAQALARSRRHKNPVGVLLLDLDHFKEVNDTLGHEAGDMLLRGAAQRLARCVRECDTVARLGGDEFVIVIGELLEPSNVEVVARRVLAAFARPFEIKDRQVHSTPSIGISVFPQDADTADELLRLADVAMYVSKSRGRATHTVFERDMLRTVERRQSVESQLREAIDRGAFTLRYLPFYDMRTGRVAGLEALVRWEHPKLGVVAPGEFMPVAEGAGLMPLIDRWVLSSACGQLASWRSGGLAAELFVAINVSARQLVDPGFPDLLKGALAGAALAPQDLQVEVTETVLAQGGASVDSALSQIKALGVRVALDDYGAGYSWLTRLSGLAVDVLKVDRTLIQGMTGDPRVRVIVQALIAVGHSMGKQIVAEGVETREQLEMLKGLGSSYDVPLARDQAQGYLFSKPVPPEDVAGVLARTADMGHTTGA